METVALSSSELETLEAGEIKALGGKPQRSWSMGTLAPIAQMSLLLCPGLRSAPTPVQRRSPGLRWVSALFKIFSGSFPHFSLSRSWTFTTLKGCQANEGTEPWAAAVATGPPHPQPLQFKESVWPEGSSDKTNKINSQFWTQKRLMTCSVLFELFFLMHKTVTGWGNKTQVGVSDSVRGALGHKFQHKLKNW